VRPALMAGVQGRHAWPSQGRASAQTPPGAGTRSQAAHSNSGTPGIPSAAVVVAGRARRRDKNGERAGGARTLRATTSARCWECPPPPAPWPACPRQPPHLRGRARGVRATSTGRGQACRDARANSRGMTYNGTAPRAATGRAVGPQVASPGLGWHAAARLDQARGRSMHSHLRASRASG
jgi:hypothetical protein